MLSKYRNSDFALLLLRLGLAYVFIEHSLQKLTNPQMTAVFFGRLGLPLPNEFMYFICIIELLGGVAMLLGVFSDVAGLLLAADMLGVIITVRMGPMASGWLGGHEFELMLMLMALAVALMGAGRYALQRPEKKQILV